MLTTSQSEALITTLVDAWKAVGSVLTGEQVDLRQSDEITCSDLRHTAGLLATYAWHGEWPYGHMALEGALHELSTAIELIRGSFMLPDGTDLFGPEQKNALQRLASAATARWSLDNNDTISIEMLAALAGVSEKTVRTATNPKAPNPIAIIKDGHWTLIEAAEALTWLSRRPSFRHTRLQGGSPTQPPLSDVSVLAQTGQAWLSNADLTPDALANQLDWNEAQTLALKALLGGHPQEAFIHLGPARLRQFAEEVGMPEPNNFARHGYRQLALAHSEALASIELDASTN